jgi:hypothetical protein
MRYVLPLLMLALIPFTGNVLAEDLKPEETLKAIRNLDLKFSESNEPTRADKDLLSFDQAKDEVIWVRTYGENKITQIYEIVKDRMNVKEGVVIIPLKWLSMANPGEMNYNPDKHDSGIRVIKKDGKFVATFYSIDTQGVEADLTFVEGKE